MAKSVRVRIRGAPRKEPDLHLIAQAVVMHAKEVEERTRQEREGKRDDASQEGLGEVWLRRLSYSLAV